MNTSFKQLSETQQIVLNILPIPSAILSILGSTAIIYLALQRRKVQNWTPYTRLLVAMSICDILFSLNIGIGTFLRPKETSIRLWAFGNDSTCSFVGFMNQVAFSGIWYQGMLSIYFLLTARFGMKNAKIAKFIEPLMHFLALGYNFGGAIASITLGVYAERNGPISCYVGRFYGDSDGSQSEKERRDMMVDLSYKFPVAAVTACLICTQVSIYVFVRRHTRKGISSESIQTESNRDTSLGWSERVQLRSESKENSKQEEVSRVSSIGGSSSSSRRRKRAQKKSANAHSRQSQRLWLVCTQAFLFVFSFLLCNVCSVFMVIEQNKAQSREEELATIAKYFPVAVIQAIIVTIQGLFNGLIFIRPKFLMLRLEFPNEEKRWTVKRIFMGQKLEPTVPNAGKSDERIGIAVQPQHGPEHDGRTEPIGDTTKNSKSNATSKSRAGRNNHMMSSMTASDGDFDSVIDALGEDEDASKDAQKSTSAELTCSNRVPTLEAIGEMSECDVDATPIQANGPHPSSSDASLSTPQAGPTPQGLPTLPKSEEVEEC